MVVSSNRDWPRQLLDPVGHRTRKPRAHGKTMVIDKGLGIRAFKDLLETSAEYMDIIKLGFGTAALYPSSVLKDKIQLAKEYGLTIMPGGTFLEVAVKEKIVPSFFQFVIEHGFNGIEVSDGTIDLERSMRNELIQRGIEAGLSVTTEYGKKIWGSSVQLEDLIETVESDLSLGAEHVTIEGRESGMGVGLFNEHGQCKEDEISELLVRLPSKHSVLWEAPLKAQQVYFIQHIGSDVHLGNVAPNEVLSLEALRRGLRSDTLFMS